MCKAGSNRRDTARTIPEICVQFTVRDRQGDGSPYLRAFFTTKEKTKNRTGALDQSMDRERSGGYILVSSEAEFGTKMRRIICRWWNEK